MGAFKVEHDSPLTAWGQIQRDLRRRIDGGEFPTGRRIPPEVDLVEEYGVSRMTVRRAVGALTDDGYLTSRRGSGTYVIDRADQMRCDLNPLLPWREQFAAIGRDAVSTLVETREHAQLPDDIARIFRDEPRDGPLTFGRHVQAVDGIPIGTTESWVAPAQFASGRPLADRTEVVADSFAEVGYASSAQALLLRSYLDIPLLVVTTRSRLTATSQLVEIARTSWLGSRVRFRYGRELTVDQIDMTGLLRARDVD